MAQPQAVAAELCVTVLHDAAVIGIATDAVAGRHLRVDIELIAIAVAVVGRTIDDDLAARFEGIDLLIGDEGLAATTTTTAMSSTMAPSTSTTKTTTYASPSRAFLTQPVDLLD